MVLSVSGWDAACSYVWQMHVSGTGKPRCSSRLGTSRTGTSLHLYQAFSWSTGVGSPCKCLARGMMPRAQAQRRCQSAQGRELTGLRKHQEISEEFHEFEEEYRSKRRSWHKHVKMSLQRKEK